MEREHALRCIEETIGPFIGRHMAKASTELHSRKLALPERITLEQLREVLDGIGKGMFVLVGREKTTELLRQIEASLGVQGVPR
jgi:hypothetical protein